MPVVPAGKGDAVVTSRFVPGIVMVSALVSDWELPSSTSTVKFEFPGLVGVPLITPVEARLRPAGKEPAETDQEYGAAPPLAANV